jgi:hypothetical protein
MAALAERQQIAEENVELQEEVAAGPYPIDSLVVSVDLNTVKVAPAHTSPKS